MKKSEILTESKKQKVFAQFEISIKSLTKFASLLNKISNQQRAKDLNKTSK